MTKEDTLPRQASAPTTSDGLSVSESAAALHDVTVAELGEKDLCVSEFAEICSDVDTLASTIKGDTGP